MTWHSSSLVGSQEPRRGGIQRWVQVCKTSSKRPSKGLGRFLLRWGGMTQIAAN